jgi:hypothetical protein
LEYELLNLHGYPMGWLDAPLEVPPLGDLKSAQKLVPNVLPTVHGELLYFVQSAKFLRKGDELLDLLELENFVQMNEKNG